MSADSSECSYLSDHEKPKNMHKQKKYQALKLEKKHLEDVNKNLNENLENVRKQLQDAFAMLESSNDISNKLQEMQKQLSVSNDEKQNLHNQIQNLVQTNEETVSKLQNEVSSLTKQKEETTKLLSEQANKIAKLSKDLKAYKTDNELNRKVLEEITGKYQQMKTKKDKLTQKYASLSQKCEQAEQENQNLRLEQENLMNENLKLNSDIDSLNMKLNTASALNGEAEKSLVVVSNELEQKNKVILSLEQQIRNQKLEIEKYTLERSKMIKTLSGFQQIVLFSENSIDNLTKEIESLKQKNKSTPKAIMRPFMSKEEFDDLFIPFNGDLKNACQNFKNLPQYQPLQRIQLMLNETAKVVSNLTTENEKLKSDLQKEKKHFETYTADQVKYHEINDALVEELNHLSQNQIIINSNLIDSSQTDTDIITFVTEKLEKMTNSMQRELIKDPKFINSNFFTTSDVEQRRRSLEKLLKGQNDNVLRNLFLSLFFVSTILEKQLKSVTTSLSIMEEISKCGSLKGTQIRDIPHFIESINTRIQQEKATNKKLTKYIAKNEEKILKLTKSDTEKKTQICELSSRCETLENENKVLSLKLQLTQNELSIKKAEYEQISKVAEDIKNGCEERANYQKSRTDRLEEDLKQKTKQCADLTDSLKDLQEKLEDHLKSQRGTVFKSEQNLTSQIEALNNQLMEYEKTIMDLKQKLRRNKAAMREKLEKCIEESYSNFDKSKKVLEDLVESLKAKSKEAEELNQKLTEASSAQEAKITQLAQENSELKEKMKQVQSETNLERMNIQKEKQAVQAKASAQMIAQENKHMKLINEERQKSRQAVKKLLEKFAENVGSFYGIEPNDINEDIFEHMIKSTRDDLEKLRYFQNESLK